MCVYGCFLFLGLTMFSLPPSFPPPLSLSFPPSPPSLLPSLSPFLYAVLKLSRRPRSIGRVDGRGGERNEGAGVANRKEGEMTAVENRSDVIGSGGIGSSEIVRSDRMERSDRKIGSDIIGCERMGLNAIGSKGSDRMTKFDISGSERIGSKRMKSN